MLIRNKNKIWEDPYKDIQGDINFEYNVLLSDKEFIKLQKLYKFVLDPNSLTAKDTKWNKCVTKLIKDKQNPKQYLIYFNGNWLYNEAVRTDSETIVEILKNNLECYYLYKLYKQQKQEKNKEFSLFTDNSTAQEDTNELD